MIIDTHAHLDMNAYCKDLDAVLQRAKNTGVELCVCPGTEIKTWDRNISLIEKYSQLYAIMGVHPHEAKLYDDKVDERLMRLLKHEKVKALGEIGLDYNRNFSPQDQQREVFKRQLEIYQEVGLPLVIHLREADDDLLNILKRVQKADYRGVVHCYSSSLKVAKELLKMGFHLSFTCNVTYKNADDKRNVVRYLKQHPDRIMAETDSPFILPRFLRGREKRNEPANVIFVVQTISELWEMSFDEVSRITTDNAMRLFGIGEG